MAGDAPAVTDHLGTAALRGLIQPLSVAFEAVFESKFLVHPDHLWVFAVADIAARGLADRGSGPHNHQQSNKPYCFHEHIIIGLDELDYDPDHTPITACHNYFSIYKTEQTTIFSGELTIFTEVIKWEKDLSFIAVVTLYQ